MEDWWERWREPIVAAMAGYNPSLCVILSADIDEEVGRGAVLLSGNNDPIYPYEERVFRAGEVWRGGNSSNGPTMESVWTDDDDDDDDDLYDASFWLDVAPEADAVRVSVDGSTRDLPSSHGLAVCFIAGIPETEVRRHRPTVVARRLGGQWVE